MNKLIAGVATAATATLVAIAVATSPASASPIWTDPTCTTVDGPGALTFTKDDGATLAANTRPGPVTYTNGLTPLETPDTLVAVQEKSVWPSGSTTITVWRSADAGCSWQQINTLPQGQNVQATPAGDDRAYLWSDSPQPGLYRLDGTAVTTLTDPTPRGLTGLAVDPFDGDHVVIGDTEGQLYETFDGGAIWGTMGSPPGGLGIYGVYDVAFDPIYLSHAVAGTGDHGAYVTTDGGTTWTQADGLDLTPTGTRGVNVFSLAVSPADTSVVYAMGLDLDETEAHVPSDGRHVYRSTDGGFTFTPIVDQTADITLYNGPGLFPSPVDPGVLYFEFGSSYQGTGTYLYKYTANTGAVTWTRNDYHGIDALAFNPVNPNTLYLGLSVEP